MCFYNLSFYFFEHIIYRFSVVGVPTLLYKFNHTYDG